jgi:transposase
MSEVQDLSSYSAWQRRGELLENTVPIEIPKKKKAKKRRSTQQVVKKQMPEPDEEAVV